MPYDPDPAPRHAGYPSDTANALPLALWILWTLTVIAAATWVAWPALWSTAPLDLPRLIITSALVGVAGLLTLTVVEIHIAPWRFLE